MHATCFYIFMSIFCMISMQSSALGNDLRRPNVVVKTKLGKVRGAVKKLDAGKKVNQFFGIPFAQPPVGELRWKEPKPIEKWKKVFDASKLYPPHCPQVKFTVPEEMEFRFDVPGPMDEDCLYLNIYTPASATPKSNLSVMVFIHGGGFEAGAALTVDGSFLAVLNDVVVVTINYRLGVLGFLPFPGTNANGNYGMFDQIMALQWVKDNIESFGGNPDSVTIFGNSAGGASVSLLTLSPLSKGLFHRAVAQSGTALASWGITDSQDFSFVRDFGSYLNCTEEKWEDLQKCLQHKRVDDIIKGQEHISLMYMASLIPRVDGKFLTDHPINLLENGQIHDVDQIIGINQNEGDLMVYVFNMASLPLSMVVGMFAGKEPQAVQDAITFEYTVHSTEASESELREKSSDFMTDFYYAAPADATARLVSKAGKNVHFYVLAHRNKHSVYPDWFGATHGEEVGYTVGTPMNVSSQTFYATRAFTEMEKGLSLSVMKMWSNFAKTGNPSVPEDGDEWQRFTSEDPAFLSISLEPEMKKNLKPKAMAFWNQYLPKLKKNLKAHKSQA